MPIHNTSGPYLGSIYPVMLILQDAEDVLLSLMNQVDTLTRYTNDCLKVRQEHLDMDRSVCLSGFRPSDGKELTFLFSLFEISTLFILKRYVKYRIL
jgi:hypothetical protein